MNKSLVSVVTPCYNGEKYLKRYFESILMQTYGNIELIFVNDGSTDDTEKIALEYTDKLEERGIKYIYLSQSNQGQAEAINKGLSIFSGEYLTWPDSDDTMEANAIEKKVNYLENNKDCDLLICSGQIIYDNNGKKGGILRREKEVNDNLFLDLILERNVFFVPGGYMVRASSFLESNPSRTIYSSRCGQNWQMLLPIAYKANYCYVNDILFNYYIRNNSHSRKDISLNDVIIKFDLQEDCLNKVICCMGIPEEKEIIETIGDKYLRKKFELYCEYHYYDEAIIKYKLLKEKNKNSLKDLIWLYMCKNSTGAQVLRSIFNMIMRRK
ncbi:MAG: glycosyltransferase family A protein [Bacilli bacterium]